MADLNDFLDITDEELDQIQASTGRGEPFPEGDYTLKAETLDVERAKSGNGIVLKAKLVVAEGEYSGRVVFENFNIKNTNTQAQKIGIADLKALCNACGVTFEIARSDTSALIDIPFRARVLITPESTKNGTTHRPRNNVGRYVPSGEAPKAAPAAASASPAAPKAVGAVSAAAAENAAPRAPAAGKMPWDKKSAA